MSATKNLILGLCFILSLHVNGQNTFSALKNFEQQDKDLLTNKVARTSTENSFLFSFPDNAWEQVSLQSDQMIHRSNIGVNSFSRLCQGPDLFFGSQSVHFHSISGIRMKSVLHYDAMGNLVESELSFKIGK